MHVGLAVNDEVESMTFATTDDAMRHVEKVNGISLEWTEDEKAQESGYFAWRAEYNGNVFEVFEMT